MMLSLTNIRTLSAYFQLFSHCHLFRCLLPDPTPAAETIFGPGDAQNNWAALHNRTNWGRFHVTSPATTKVPDFGMIVPNITRRRWFKMQEFYNQGVSQENYSFTLVGCHFLFLLSQRFFFWLGTNNTLGSKYLFKTQRWRCSWSCCMWNKTTKDLQLSF